MCRKPYHFFDRLSRDDNAATAIEYALIAVFIAVAIMATIYALGAEELASVFQDIASAF